ncbi:MAG: hypothetical protein KDJ22_07890 [Candidatus Competibacteraceae bacterium]|nr:hypothetical protein [Candidatus Competibacteraceae bacterium]MCP5125225.1 hypothetical protein [Gammaproteobacteria bacterium]HRX70945.1 Ig-like domain-containing protein [Candidatus Competibacteraceae bacterium]
MTSIIKADWLFMGILCLGASSSAWAALQTALEGPSDEQTVSGIEVIRGWAFSDLEGVQIHQVTLSIDGQEITTIPCCSARSDVASAFPDYPAANTRQSGYGLTFNFNSLSTGTHTVEVAIRDSSGAELRNTHQIHVVKPGTFPFIDRVDLSVARAELQGQDIVLNGARIRDQGSQQEESISVRLRWFQNIQRLGIIDAASSAGLSTRAGTATANVTPAAFTKTQSGDVSGIRYAALESPNEGDTGSGIAVIRGWAIAPAERAINRVQLLIDGEPSITLPCCSRRTDVAAAFPDEPNAANSGFGATFNYGNLTPGNHSLTLEIEDSSGAVRTFTRGLRVRNPGNFAFLENLDLGAASVDIVAGQLAVRNAQAQDRVSGQVVRRNLRYQWDVPSQGFALVDEGLRDVRIANTGCAMNGDTSSLDALLGDSGPDGVSLVELLTALRVSPVLDRVLADFQESGVVQCRESLPSVQGPLTLNGDVNGDGNPDVVINGTRAEATVHGTTQTGDTLPYGLEINGNDVTVRGLSLTNFTGTGIRIALSDTREVANIAILDSAISHAETGVGVGSFIEGIANAKPIRDLLISQNRINDTTNGIKVEVDGTTNARLERITLASNRLENLIENPDSASYGYGIVVGPGWDNQGSVFHQIHIVGNMVKAAASDGILIKGGEGESENNLLESFIRQNEISDCSNGIVSVGGFYDNANNNTLLMDISDNRLKGNHDNGIIVIGGIAGGARNAIDITIQGNVSTFDGTGVSVRGGNDEGAMENQILTEIRDNELRESGYAGIQMEGGGSAADGNTVDGAVINNWVSNNYDGVVLNGGFEATNNLLSSRVESNTLQDSLGAGVAMRGGWSATANVLNAEVRDNTVSDTHDGLFVCGGSAKQRGSNTSSANNNSALVDLLSNVVQRTAALGIAVFGGCEPEVGDVANNRVEAILADNQADSIDCQNNIASNTADCTLSGSAQTRDGAVSERAMRERVTWLPRLSTAAVNRVRSHQMWVQAREKRLRALAADVQDRRLSQRLLRFSDRLRRLDDRLGGLTAAIERLNP